MTGKSKIFFDGNCIVCDTEILHYKRIAPDLFDIVDITGDEFVAAKYGLSSEAVHHEMHVLTPEGEIKVGVDAFAHIWSRINKYKLAAKVLKLPFIYSIAKTGYWLFARVRHFLPKKAKFNHF